MKLILQYVQFRKQKQYENPARNRKKITTFDTRNLYILKFKNDRRKDD